MLPIKTALYCFPHECRHLLPQLPMKTQGFYDSSPGMNHVVFSRTAWQLPTAPPSYLCHVGTCVVTPGVPPWTDTLCSSLEPARDCPDSESCCFCVQQERSRVLIICCLPLSCLTVLSTQLELQGLLSFLGAGCFRCFVSLLFQPFWTELFTLFHLSS